jgi:hypothetical protein
MVAYKHEEDTRGVLLLLLLLLLQVLLDVVDMNGTLAVNACTVIMDDDDDTSY